jgi:hypothetical protein
VVGVVAGGVLILFFTVLISQSALLFRREHDNVISLGEIIIFKLQLPRILFAVSSTLLKRILLNSNYI